MNVKEVITLGRNKLDENGLSEWKIKAERAYSRAGVCFSYEKEIRISKQYIEIMSDEDILDTIFHEIAHAIIGIGHGHDNVWKKKCLDLGCRPNRLLSNEFQVERKWVSVCSACGARFGRMKRAKERRWCGECDNKMIGHGLKFKPNIKYKG